MLISKDATFRDAINLMISKKTNSLLVVDDEGKLCGEIAVSDLLNAIVPEYSDPDAIVDGLGTEKGFQAAVKGAENSLVFDFMSMDVEAVHVDDTLLTIASTALTHGTMHIPIVDHDNRPIGVISRRGIKQILAKYLGIKETTA